MLNNIKKILKILFQYPTDNTEEKPSLEILPCLEHIALFLKKEGISCKLQRYQILSEQNRPITHANLLAFNPKLKGPFILFQGHIDTVPFNPPYRFKIKSKILQGRGAVDMKGPLAGMITAFIALYKKANFLKYPPALLITSDEEANSFTGIKTFLANNHPPILFAINGESTRLRIGTRFLGVLAYELKRKGKGGHSASVYNDHLIEKMIPVVKSINDFLIKSRMISDKNFGKTIGAFTVLNSGNKANQLPENFKASWNLRTVKERKIYDRIFRATVAKNIDKNIKINSFYYNPLKINVPPRIKKCLKNAFKHTGIDYKESIVNFFTEACLINQKNIPTIVCGPGNPELAHTRAEEEIIKINDISKYSEILQNIVKEINS